MSLTLYYWNTPNGHKPVILLEELGLPYTIEAVNIGRGEQFRPEFLAISPNNKIPALVDARDAAAPIALFESGAILSYLAETSGRFLPAAGAPRYRALQWLYWQVSGLGPMAGQTHHFVRYAPEPVPYAIARYVAETSRLYRVLDGALQDREWVAGDYTIADMAIYPWVVEHELQRQPLTQYPHIARWFAAMQARPAVQRAYARAEQVLGSSRASFDADARARLFPGQVP